MRFPFVARFLYLMAGCVAAISTATAEVFEAHALQPGRRATWKMPFTEDLSMCDGFEFDFRVSDPSRFSPNYAFYARCGRDGYYNGRLALTLNPGEWSRVTVKKSDLTIGTGARDGWHALQEIQVIGYIVAPGEATAEIKNLRPIVHNATNSLVAICYRESGPLCDAKGAVSRQMAARYTKLSKALESMGLAPLMASEKDFSLETLAEKAALVFCLGKSGKAYSNVIEIRLDEVNDTLVETLTAKIRDRAPSLSATVAQAKSRAAIERESRRRDALSMPPIGGERRYLYCHDPFLSKDGFTGWDDVASFASRNGMTGLVVNMSRGVYAAYSSNVLKPWPRFGKGVAGDDVLEECKAACRRHNLDLTAWRCCWTTPARFTDSDTKNRFRSSDRACVTADGVVSDETFCPTHPKNLRLEVEAAVELAKRGVDGVNLDFIRYKGSDVCFCARCKALFEKKIGHSVDWKKDVSVRGSLYDKWIDFRAENINAAVRSIGERIHSEAPGVRVSASVFGDAAGARVYVGQDFPHWCRQGWIDEVHLMDYLEDGDAFEALLRIQLGLDVGKATLCPLIGLSCWTDGTRSLENLSRQIGIVRKLGFSRWGVFDLGGRSKEVLPELRKGPTAEVLSKKLPAPREKILEFFERNVYGEIPPAPMTLKFECLERGPAFNGVAERRQYMVHSEDACGRHEFRVLLYLPEGTCGKMPVFCYPNFSGNHTLSGDPAVIEEKGNVYCGKRFARGGRADRMPVEYVLKRGFAVATWCYASLYPDFGRKGELETSVADSVYAIFPSDRRGQRLAHPAWAWGAMRVRDLLATLEEIDQGKVGMVGQSRMGKNSVITGAFDTRFAFIGANCGGVKPLGMLPNLVFPLWFSERMKAWARNRLAGVPLDQVKAEASANALPPPPFDQSELIGCIAPRAFYTMCATEDLSSYPESVLETVRAAQPYFRECGGNIGWHEKRGRHSIEAADWRRYCDFAAYHLGWLSQTKCVDQVGGSAAKRGETK